MWTLCLASPSSPGYPQRYPPVFHNPFPRLVTLRKELTTTATDITIIIAAAANAAGIVVGLGQLKQALADIRDDVRAQRHELQSCLQTLLLLIKPGNPGEPH